MVKMHKNKDLIRDPYFRHILQLFHKLHARLHIRLIRMPLGKTSYQFKRSKGIKSETPVLAQKRTVLLIQDFLRRIGIVVFGDTISIYDKSLLAGGQIFFQKLQHRLAQVKSIHAGSNADAVITGQIGLVFGYVENVN